MWEEEDLNKVLNWACGVALGNGSVQGKELDSMAFVGLFQLSWFCDSVALAYEMSFYKISHFTFL